MNFFSSSSFSAVIFLCVVPTFSLYDNNEEAREDPRVFLVSGNISCSESASVLLEYEVWHIDPQEAVAVSMYLHNIHETEGYAYHRQRLIQAGGLPSGEMMLSRLREGKYLIELELVRSNMSEASIIAAENSTMVISTGDAWNMAQSLQRDHCNHEPVLPFVQSLHDGAFDDPAKAELAFQGIVFQTLQSYTEGFDHLLRQVQLLVGPDVFFVEIGANDGRFADPLYAKVREWGWRGLLVEPLPDVFRLLRQNYAGSSGLAFENVAVTEAAGEVRMRRVPLDVVREMEEECRGQADPGMCRYAIGVGTVKNDSYSHWILREKGVDVTVESVTLEALFRRNGVGAVHVFQVDAEGSDGDIVLQLLAPGMEEHAPLLLQMEVDHLEPPVLAQVVERLRGAEYTMRTFGGDMLAVSAKLRGMMAG